MKTGTKVVTCSQSESMWETLNVVNKNMETVKCSLKTKGKLLKGV